MPDSNALARLLITAGVLLAVVGLIILYLGRVPGFGRLPGDVLIRRGNFTFYAPFATMILLSLILSFLLRLFRR